MTKHELNILNMELESLKSELLEYKIYIEICSVTLFFVMVAFLGSEYGAYQLQNKALIAYTILFTAVLLFVAILYMLVRILYIINKRVEDIRNKKRSLLRNWLE